MLIQDHTGARRNRYSASRLFRIDSNMSIFKAYFDASGTKHDQVSLAVGGFVATTDEWLDRLKRDGLNCFHASELGKLGAPRKERLMEDLCSIIRDHVTRKFGVIVVNESISTCLSAEECKKWRIQSFSLAGRTVAAEARFWATSWSGPMPELIFEDGDEGRCDLIYLLKSQGYDAPTFKFKRDRTDRKSGVLVPAAIQLQAADLFAYKLFDMDRRCKNDLEFRAKSVGRIQPDLDKIPGNWGWVEKERPAFVRDGIEQKDSQIMVVRVKVDCKRGW